MKTIRLLTVGNSFSQNALTYLEPIAESMGQVAFVVGRASLGGCSLEKHWNLADYTVAHPEYKTYALGTLGGDQLVHANLQEALVAEPWDVVTLQQVSRKSWREDTYEPHLGRLVELTRGLAPQASVNLHQTWAYRTDCPFYAENGLTQQTMHERIAAVYGRFSEAYGCRILQSGEAVHRARTEPGYAFQWPEEGYEYLFAAAPELPVQENSFAAGWHWRMRETPEGVPELRLDATHLNARGNYLIGCLWYEVLSGQATRDGVYVPAGIAMEDAARLRRIAHEVASLG